MRILSRILGAILINAAALWLASKFFLNFELSNGPKEILFVALIFTALNYTVRPILKLLLGPVILLTLGLGLILVNGFILYLLDKLTSDLSIQGIPTLIYATVAIGVVNFIFHLFTRHD